MRKLRPDECRILELLYYFESYDTLLSDTGLQPGELRDNLITLKDMGLLEAFEEDPAGRMRPTTADTDHPDRFSYRITNAGLRRLKVNQP